MSPSSVRVPIQYLAAAVFYAAVAIAWTYPLATQSTTHTAMPAPSPLLAGNDQAIGASIAARNAAAILEGEPGKLIDQSLCFPTDKVAAFGEHVIELGILAVPGYALTGDPLFAYNSATLLTILIGGISMFALVRFWTGSSAAGLVAGLLFTFHPARINSISHPYVIGIHWMPLVLLFFERLLRNGKMLDALLLGLVASLQCLVGSYPMATLPAFALPFGLVRLVQLRTVLSARKLGLLGVAVAMVAGTTAALLRPYGIVADVWGELPTRGLTLTTFGSLLPGDKNAIGFLAIGLAALLFRFRTKASPAGAILVGIGACVALAGNGVLWPGGPKLSGLYPWLAEHFWLLGAARVPGWIRGGVYLGIAALAGLGLGRALERLRTRTPLATLIGAIVTGLVLVEYFVPFVGTRVYTTRQRVDVVGRAQGESILGAYTAFDGYPGAILDLPYNWDWGIVFQMPQYAFSAAYHGRRTAACFSSHVPASYFAVSRMASHLPSQEAIDGLAAAGLRNLVLHHGLDPLLIRLALTLSQTPGVELVHVGQYVRSYRISKPVDVHSDPGALRLLAAYRHEDRFQGIVRDVVDLEVRNDSEKTWVLPRPIRPHAVRVHWDSKGDGEEIEQRVLLPLALAPGATDLLPIPLFAAPAGCGECRPSLEIPDLGWTVPADNIAPYPYDHLPGARAAYIPERLR